MSASIQPVTTARIHPRPHLLAPEFSLPHWVFVAALVLIVAGGFGLRVYKLSVDGLSEDELNKLRAVEDYRQRGLTAANGEHPMLMKALLTLSVIAAESIDRGMPEDERAARISLESKLRFPGVLLGALTSLLIFFVAKELFGSWVALIAAAAWAFDPAAIGFNRIAKEDTFLVFFFLLANVFWLRGQRIAENGGTRPEINYWLAAACFGAMVASKYIPHYLAISTSYYYAFQGVPSAKWRLGKAKWLIFFAVMGVAFLVCNPTILLPATWQEMRVFASEKRIGHDAYEFMGHLYRNQMSLWLKGSPWYFYYAFIALKTPFTILLGLVCGIPLAFSKRVGDGRIFLLFWVLFWFLPFTVLGGKFTRYYTFALPLVLIIAAIGINRLSFLIVNWCAMRWPLSRSIAWRALHAVIVVLFLSAPIFASLRIAPFYRLYNNTFGGGLSQAGNYFPHDEFYDGSVREAAYRVATLASPGVRVVSETPELVLFYLKQAGRNDLTSVSLSDKQVRSRLTPGDIIITARGRRYFSNEVLLDALQAALTPVASLTYGPAQAILIYSPEESELNKLRIAGHL